MAGDICHTRSLDSDLRELRRFQINPISEQSNAIFFLIEYAIQAQIHPQADRKKADLPACLPGQGQQENIPEYLGDFDIFPIFPARAGTHLVPFIKDQNQSHI
ncbi:hypothetical protein [Novacetimonas cocois]|uniref:hypothetical protein n=1 Tax=Novacetimonas cocois TaxID=1747507 RepID=UPI001402F042|nr:hypothetical protein [Novacetimonas cocois]